MPAPLLQLALFPHIINLVHSAATVPGVSMLLPPPPRPLLPLFILIWLSFFSCSHAARSSYESLYSGSGHVIQTDNGNPPYSVSGRFVVAMRRSYFNVAGGLMPCIASLPLLLQRAVVRARLITCGSAGMRGVHGQRYIPGHVRIIVRDRRGRRHKVFFGVLLSVELFAFF